MKVYKNVKSIDKADLRSAVAKLKGNWKKVEREISRVAKAEEKVVGRAAKKAFKSVKHAIPRRPTKKKQ